MVNPESLKYYSDGILSGDRRILAKAITLVESRHADHQELRHLLVEKLLPHTGQAIRLGITGVPGVGKSTFIESFGRMLVGQGHRLAVLAVDPSSQRSGGSILADKTRMTELSKSPQAFIRPSPSGGTLGGVARMTRETLLICEAAGFDVVLVETVGVGQSETAVASMVDFFLLLMLSGAGDEYQGIKKGILELADAVAVNKADGDNVARAEKARQQLETALHLLQPTSPNWTPPVVTCSAITRAGLEQLWKMVLNHRRRLMQTGELTARRKAQALEWMWSLIHDGLAYRFQRHPDVAAALDQTLNQVQQGELLATAAARKLLFLLDNK